MFIPSVEEKISNECDKKLTGAAEKAGYKYVLLVINYAYILTIIKER